ncbi:hypothetical protein MLD38_014027 [Melastoma candidum]|uniref:Uncharacterized protein n=1 Tax=Melastoma candidum TaxID=119954 RepID=A0ACB9RB27_9MYRT|nr:hypothetical protein MLD38_014027 [Melastoma candidum]
MPRSSHGLCIDKDTARTMSFSCSTRSFYNLKPEGVPFQWEKRPGTPKNSPAVDVIPPLSPPPAQLSMGLPKPKETSRSRFGFWTKIHAHPKSAHHNYVESDHAGSLGMQRRNSESWSSDDVCAVPQNSRCSSAMSSNVRLAKVMDSGAKDSDESSLDQPKGCGPWSFRALMVYIAKRI